MHFTVAGEVVSRNMEPEGDAVCAGQEVPVIVAAFTGHCCCCGLHRGYSTTAMVGEMVLVVLPLMLDLHTHCKM